MNQYKKHKMSKKELKQNKMLDSVINFRHFFVKNKKNFYKSFIVGFFLMILVIIMLNNKASKETKAALLFENAYSILRAKDLKSKINEADTKLKKVIREYPGTFAAVKANYYIGNIQYEYRNFKQAINSYKKVVDNGEDTYLYPISLLSIAKCYVQLGKFQKAIDYYNIIISETEGSGFISTAKISKVRALIALKKFNKAMKLLEEIKTSETLWNKEAKKLNAFLQIKLRSVK